ncbi:MAG: glyoxalase [Bacillati bacterium ANGP1]|uniref:Glyoxalase n=1 Tax=Candidatus Segetimicrobium genomatis TaxID=2569760 RepID=A0A537IQG1_9BACT|nr:MAG: glyoxalase [Terrabacteria group bacterium ANGP1]
MPAQVQTEQQFVIHPATTLGYVHLTAADLDRQIAFYQSVLGFKLHWRKDTTAGLGGGSGDLLRLTELPGARRVRGTTGLYHFAVLVPTRWELAHLLRRIVDTHAHVQGMVNHYTHLAIYIPDAEGNGIELAWDFPREQWPAPEELVRLGNGPLEPEELLGELERNPSPWTGAHPETRIGHVHLHVADLDAAGQFYQDVLGFQATFLYSMARDFGALFLSAGGYHHHIGLNIWKGAGAPPPPPDAVGLRYFTVVLPDQAELARVTARVRAAGIVGDQHPEGVLIRDPSQNGVLLTARAGL